MQAPAVGGVSVRHGDGTTVVRIRRGASLSDFAERIDADPAALVTILFHLGEMVEYGKTSEMFTNPREQRTQDYITGRYG